jgi:hypothetical protein
VFSFLLNGNVNPGDIMVKCKNCKCKIEIDDIEVYGGYCSICYRDREYNRVKRKKLGFAQSGLTQQANNKYIAENPIVPVRCR